MGRAKSKSADTSLSTADALTPDELEALPETEQQALVEQGLVADAEGPVSEEAAHRAGYQWPDGTLLGVYDTELNTWCVLTTNQVFATEDARLARAQLRSVAAKFPHEPHRIEIRALE